MVTPICMKPAVFAVISDPISNSSTPPDIDNDLICDTLDGDKDGDSYLNQDDTFPKIRMSGQT